MNIVIYDFYFYYIALLGGTISSSPHSLDGFGLSESLIPAFGFSINTRYPLLFHPKIWTECENHVSLTPNFISNIKK